MDLFAEKRTANSKGISPLSMSPLSSPLHLLPIIDHIPLGPCKSHLFFAIGVNIPSQKRYVRYAQSYFTALRHYKHNRLALPSELTRAKSPSRQDTASGFEPFPPASVLAPLKVNIHTYFFLSLSFLLFLISEYVCIHTIFSSLCSLFLFGVIIPHTTEPSLVVYFV